MDIIKTIEEKMSTLDAQIERCVSEATEQKMQSVDGTIDSLKMNEIRHLTEKANALQQQMDAFETNAKRLSGGNNRQNWVGSIVSQISDVKGFAEQVRTHKGMTFNVPVFDTKVLTGETDYVDSTTSANVVPPAYQPGIVFNPDRAQHVREFLPTGTTTSDTIRYIEEKNYVDGAGFRNTGSVMGETTFDLESKDAQVRNISTYLRLTDEMLADVPGLTSYLSARLPKKIRVKEDNALLYGVDSPFTFTGITEVASAYTDALADSNVNRFDVLIQAIAQVRDGEYSATAIMVHPDDYYNLLLTKDGQGAYVMPDSFRFGGTAPRVAGVPLIANTAITTGDFLVGDFSLGAQLFDRQQSSIRFFEQDQDNAIRGVVTVVANERIALPIYRPTAFVYGDFASALANGSA